MNKKLIARLFLLIPIKLFSQNSINKFPGSYYPNIPELHFIDSLDINVLLGSMAYGNMHGYSFVLAHDMRFKNGNLVILTTF